MDQGNGLLCGRWLAAAAGLLALAALTPGCSALGTSPRRGGVGWFGEGANPETMPRPPGQTAVQAEPLAEDPAAALEQVTAHLAQRGFRRFRGPETVQLPPTGTTTMALPVQAGRCYVVVAVAPPQRNLDLLVIGPWGQPVAQDLRPDRHPWAAFCAGGGTRHTLRLQSPDGVAFPAQIAMFEGPPTSNPALADYFRAAEGGGAPQVQRVGVPPALGPRVAAYAQQAASEGFGPALEPVGLVAAQGQAVDYTVRLPGNACFRFVVVAEGGGVQQLDAVLLGPQGESLARDQLQGADAQLEYCPEQPLDVRLRAAAQQGSGTIALALFGRSRSADGGTATAGGGQVQAGGGAAEQFAFVDGDMRSRGYVRNGEPVRLRLASGQLATQQTELQAGKCYAFLAVGDPVAVEDVDLAVRDASGQVLDVDVTVGARPTVRVCPERGGPHVVEIRMYSGKGEVLFARYDWPRGVRGPFGLRGLAYVRLAENVALLGSEGYRPDDTLTPVRGRFRQLDEERRHRIRLRGGRCYAVLVVGGEGVRVVHAALLVDGETVSATPGRDLAPFTSVRHCPERDVRAEVVVRNPSVRSIYRGAPADFESRPGPYVLQVFRQE